MSAGTITTVLNNRSIHADRGAVIGQRRLPSQGRIKYLQQRNRVAKVPQEEVGDGARRDRISRSSRRSDRRARSSRSSKKSPDGSLKGTSTAPQASAMKGYAAGSAMCICNWFEHPLTPLLSQDEQQRRGAQETPQDEAPDLWSICDDGCGQESADIDATTIFVVGADDSNTPGMRSCGRHARTRRCR